MGSRSTAAVLLAFALAGCEPATLGLPRVHASAASPDGRFVAAVRNHPTLDPPDQSLWLEPVGGPARMMLRLSADQDWCDTIIWAPDSTLVGFLIQEARLVVVRPESGRITFDAWLLDPSGAYPPPQQATDLAFLPDLSGVAFRPCQRQGNGCGGLTTIPVERGLSGRAPGSPG